MTSQILQNRLKKEIMNLDRDPPPGVSCYPKEDDLTNLEAFIKGPPDSPYEQGLFKLQVKIPQNYPFDPPQIRFSTFIYHPNIDDAGRICANILKKGEKGGWNPALNLSTTLLLLSQLLAQPNPDDPLDAEIAKEYQFDYPTFKQKAIEFTKKYANKDQVLSNDDSQEIDNTAEPEAQSEDVEEQHKEEEPKKSKLSLSKKKGSSQASSQIPSQASIKRKSTISSSLSVNSQMEKETTLSPKAVKPTPILAKASKKKLESLPNSQASFPSTQVPLQSSQVSLQSSQIPSTQFKSYQPNSISIESSPEVEESQLNNLPSMTTKPSENTDSQPGSTQDNSISIESSPEIQAEENDDEEIDELDINSGSSSPMLQPTVVIESPVLQTQKRKLVSLENSQNEFKPYQEKPVSLENSQNEWKSYQEKPISEENSQNEWKSYQERSASTSQIGTQLKSYEPNSISSPETPQEDKNIEEPLIESFSNSPVTKAIDDHSSAKDRRSQKRAFDQTFMQPQDVILLSDEDEDPFDKDDVVFTLQLSRKRHRKKLSLQRRKN